MTVCGEACEIQVCRECATPHQLDSMADYNTLQTLRQVLNDDKELKTDTRLITLECGHAFTVDTLDGHVGLTDFYMRSPSGEWVNLKTPDPGFKARPTCPTCRGHLTSPRYNRVTKRALIDIQEQHAIYNMARDSAKWRDALAAFDFDIARLSISGALQKTAPAKHLRMPDQRRLSVIFELKLGESTCVPPDMFGKKMGDFFEIHGPVFIAWMRVAERPLQIYNQLVRIVNSSRLPHVVAYQAAITSAFREEMELNSGTTSTCRDPTESAMIMARRRVGAPFPRGEARFKIEALLDTIKLRLDLALLAKAFADIYPTIPARLHAADREVRADKQHKQVAARRFGAVTWALLRSSRRDADLAANLCESAEAWRLNLTTEVTVLLAHFAFSRFGGVSRVDTLLQSRPGVRDESADSVLKERDIGAGRAFESLARVAERAMSNEQIVEWVDHTIRPAINTILTEWYEFADGLRKGEVYTTVTSEEKAAIAKAVALADWGPFSPCADSRTDSVVGTAGRFYQVSQLTDVC